MTATQFDVDMVIRSQDDWNELGLRIREVRAHFDVAGVERPIRARARIERPELVVPSGFEPPGAVLTIQRAAPPESARKRARVQTALHRKTLDNAIPGLCSLLLVVVFLWHPWASRLWTAACLAWGIAATIFYTWRELGDRHCRRWARGDDR